MVKGKLRVSRAFTGQYRLPGDAKVTRVALGVSDKQVAEAKLRRIVREAEQEREGLLPPKGQRDAAKQPISEQIDKFVESRRGLGRDEKYVCELRRKLLRLAAECGWTAVRDVNGHLFEIWRARQTLVAKTRNEYLNAVTGFCNWMEPRTGTNPMRSVGRANAAGAPKRERRALTVEELVRLVGVSGERGIVYLVAAWTGIRRGELEQIRWSDVHTDSERPHIIVRACIAKNHRMAHQPLPVFVASALQEVRPVDVVPSELAFKRLLPRMKRYRADLTASGIPYVTGKASSPTSTRYVRPTGPF